MLNMVGESECPEGGVMPYNRHCLDSARGYLAGRDASVGIGTDRRSVRSKRTFSAMSGKALRNVGAYGLFFLRKKVT